MGEPKASTSNRSARVDRMSRFQSRPSLQRASSVSSKGILPALALLSLLVGPTSANLFGQHPTCARFLKISDTKQPHEVLNIDEYLLVVNHILAQDYPGNAPFSELPKELHDLFVLDIGKGGDIDIYGIKPGEKLTEAQDASLSAVCQKTSSALDDVMGITADAAMTAAQVDGVLQEAGGDEGTGGEGPSPTDTAASGGTCQLQTVTINVDIQMKFPDQEFAACDDQAQDDSIRENIVTAMGENFASTVASWDGEVKFPNPLVFDFEQEVNNLEPVFRRLSLRRSLQEIPACSPRSAECDSEYCRWGCLIAEATNCKASTTDDWSLLEEPIRTRLAGLGYDCLGIPADIKVVLVADPPVFASEAAAEAVGPPSGVSDVANNTVVTSGGQGSYDALDWNATTADSIADDNDEPQGGPVGPTAGNSTGSFTDPGGNVNATDGMGDTDAADDSEMGGNSTDSGPPSGGPYGQGSGGPGSGGLSNATLLSGNQTQGTEDGGEQQPTQPGGNETDVGELPPLGDPFSNATNGGQEPLPPVPDGANNTGGGPLDGSNATSPGSNATSPADTLNTTPPTGNGTDGVDQPQTPPDGNATGGEPLLPANSSDTNETESFLQPSEPPVGANETGGEQPPATTGGKNATPAIINATGGEENNSTGGYNFTGGYNSTGGDYNGTFTSGPQGNGTTTNQTGAISPALDTDTVKVTSGFIIKTDRPLLAADKVRLTEAISALLIAINTELQVAGNSTRLLLRARLRRLATVDENSIDIFSVKPAGCPKSNPAADALDGNQSATGATISNGTAGNATFGNETQRRLQDLSSSKNSTAGSNETVAAPSSSNASSSTVTSPQTSNSSQICQEVYFSYDVFLEDGENSEYVREQYETATTTAIDDGELQERVDKLDPPLPINVLASTEPPPAPTAPPTVGTNAPRNETLAPATQSPTNATDADEQKEGDDGGMNLLVIVGAALGGIVLCGCCFVLAGYMYTQRNKDSDKDEELEGEDPEKGEVKAADSNNLAAAAMTDDDQTTSSAAQAHSNFGDEDGDDDREVPEEPAKLSAVRFADEPAVLNDNDDWRDESGELKSKSSALQEGVAAVEEDHDGEKYDDEAFEDKAAASSQGPVDFDEDDDEEDRDEDDDDEPVGADEKGDDNSKNKEDWEDDPEFKSAELPGVLDDAVREEKQVTDGEDDDERPDTKAKDEKGDDDKDDTDGNQDESKGDVMTTKQDDLVDEDEEDDDEKLDTKAKAEDGDDDNDDTDGNLDESEGEAMAFRQGDFADEDVDDDDEKPYTKAMAEDGDDDKDDTEGNQDESVGEATATKRDEDGEDDEERPDTKAKDEDGDHDNDDTDGNLDESEGEAMAFKQDDFGDEDGDDDDEKPYTKARAEDGDDDKDDTEGNQDESVGDAMAIKRDDLADEDGEDDDEKLATKAKDEDGDDDNDDTDGNLDESEGDAMVTKQDDLAEEDREDDDGKPDTRAKDEDGDDNQEDTDGDLDETERDVYAGKSTTTT